MNNQTVEQALLTAQQQLRDIADDRRLEAQYLLSSVLNKNRAWLLSHEDHDLRPEDLNRFQALVSKRAQGEPVAYLVGYKDFWDLRLEVMSETLIPRPETELLVELSLSLLPPETQLLELGTGSGAIACALAKAKPHWYINAIDQSQACVGCAQRNADRYQLNNTDIWVSDWFDQVPKNNQYDAIISNPPYIAEDDPHLQQGDVTFEPKAALISGCDGLKDIRHIAKTAPHYLKPGGFCLIEHGYTQGNAVRELLTQVGFQNCKTQQDLAGLDRVTLGQKG